MLGSGNESGILSCLPGLYIVLAVGRLFFWLTHNRNFYAKIVEEEGNSKNKEVYFERESGGIMA